MLWMFVVVVVVVVDVVCFCVVRFGVERIDPQAVVHGNVVLVVGMKGSVCCIAHASQYFDS